MQMKEAYDLIEQYYPKGDIIFMHMDACGKLSDISQETRPFLGHNFRVISYTLHIDTTFYVESCVDPGMQEIYELRLLQGAIDLIKDDEEIMVVHVKGTPEAFGMSAARLFYVGENMIYSLTKASDNTHLFCCTTHSDFSTHKMVLYKKGLTHVLDRVDWVDLVENFYDLYENPINKLYWDQVQYHALTLAPNHYWGENLYVIDNVHFIIKLQGIWVKVKPIWFDIHLKNLPQEIQDEYTIYEGMIKTI